MPLDALNPAHPEFFEADKHGPYFERLRRERSGALHAREPVRTVLVDHEVQPTSCMSTRITRFSRRKLAGRHHARRPTCRRRIAGSDYRPADVHHEDPPKHDLQRGSLHRCSCRVRSAACSNRSFANALARSSTTCRATKTFNWVRHVSVELTGQMLATLFDFPFEKTVAS